MSATPTRDALIAKLMTLTRGELANIVADALTPAGAMSEWDSETIEYVLTPFKRPLAALGVPWVGDTGQNDENHLYWATIADETGDEHDYEFENDDEEDEDEG